MTKIVEAIRPGSSRRAPVIALRLAAAREVARSLEQDVGQLVLDAAEGVSGAGKRLADLRTTAAAAKRDVTELEAAHATAIRLDRQSEAEAVATRQAEQLATVSTHARARLDAATELSAGIAAAAEALAKFVEAHSAMVAALSTGGAMPAGADTMNLRSLVAGEIFRACDVSDPNDPRLIPAGKPFDFTQWQNAKSLAPLVDTIRTANEQITSTLRSRQAETNLMKDAS